MNERNEQKIQIRCSIYALSAVADLQSTVAQIERCKHIAREHGWGVDDQYVYQDVGVSGLCTAKRAGLERLLITVQADACPIDRLLVADPSRLSRDSKFILNLFDMLTAHGVSIYAADMRAEVSRQSLESIACFAERFRAIGPRSSK